ncbi:MAG: hypothetical protein ACR2OZ_02335 [Verrucomicrobiales bacterium]
MQICAVDTNVLMRLASGDPAPLFQQTVETLNTLLDQHPGLRIVAHNIVIGEAYITLVKFYGMSPEESRQALLHVLGSGLIEPLDGPPALEALGSGGKGAGLIDRMILLDSHARQSLPLYTLDDDLAKLSGARKLFTPAKASPSA